MSSESFVTEVNKHGLRVIPASRRPDGTIRKEIRVREGYVPQDEVKLYRPRQAAGASSRPAIPGLVPGAAPAGAASKSKSQKKNEKRKEARGGGSAPVETPDWAVARPRGQEASSSQTTSQGDDPTKPLRKQMGNLKTKLSQIAKLKDRETGGDKLTAEEKRKMEQEADFASQLRDLEDQLASLKT